MNENNYIIRAKDLHKTFGKGETAQVVLDGAQLDIEKGSFVSLMGESGTGKSTLLYLIGGLDRDFKGEITVSGHDYLFNNEKLTLDALAVEIGKLDKETEITITSDDTAAKNTVDELTDKLDELGYKNYKKADK